MRTESLAALAPSEGLYFEFRGPHDWYQPHSGEGGFYCALAEYDDSFH